MDKEQIKQIIESNKSFYELVAEEFSPTRKNPWNGWFTLLKIINTKYKNKKEIKVLDLGCGNGRFCAFLSKNLYKKFKYVGVDANHKFLDEASKTCTDGSFFVFDIFMDINNKQFAAEKFNLIVAFGLVHHIPDINFRKEWFKSVKRLLAKDGIFVTAFWNFISDSRFKERALKPENLEENDYFYNWGKNGPKRYFHYYATEEINDISTCAGLNILSEFYADGKTHDLNRYVMLVADEE